MYDFTKSDMKGGFAMAEIKRLLEQMTVIGRTTRTGVRVCVQCPWTCPYAVH